uniref:Uncharacterized protein n=4 Tax=Caenorhabditis japonica TaxID=281687 RepID=A0A8R1EQL0_CAEJA
MDVVTEDAAQTINESIARSQANGAMEKNGTTLEKIHPQHWCGQHKFGIDSPTSFYNYCNSRNEEKSAMCRIAEIARFNKIKHFYDLQDESGPAHKKLFTVKLVLTAGEVFEGLKACCGLTKDTPKELVYYETKMMPLKEELELGSEQFAISAMRTPGHPAKDLHTRRPAERSSGNRPRTPPLEATRSKEDEWRRQRGDTKSIQKRNHTVFVKRYLGIRQIHPTLGTTPPQVSQDEEKMPRSTRVELARLRSQRSLMLEEYKAKVENRAISPCIKCGKHEGDLCHLLRCFPTKPLQKSKLWKDPIGVARALGLATTQFDPGGAPSKNVLEK